MRFSETASRRPALGATAGLSVAIGTYALVDRGQLPSWAVVGTVVPTVAPLPAALPSYESGVHRVQRVPETEAQGRIHTSTSTVAVLPEAEEVDVQINNNDLRIDTFCSSGPGGQSVNTTYSAVRITHLPTGVVVSMQDEKSQIQNREKEMRVLLARLQEIEDQKQHDAQSAERKSMVGSGDRTEKIRTYNFKENHVTDHRIGMTVHQLDLVMEGQIAEFVETLRTHYQTEKRTLMYRTG